jgi:hypothetical protein
MAPVKVNIERVKLLEQIAANSLLQILPSMSDQEISKMYTQGVQSLDTIVTGLLGGGKQSNELLAFLKPFIDNIPTLDNIRGGKKRKRKKTRKKGGSRTKRESSSSSGEKKEETKEIDITALARENAQQRRTGQMLGGAVGGEAITQMSMIQLQKVSSGFIDLNKDVSDSLVDAMARNREQHNKTLLNFKDQMDMITKEIKAITKQKGEASTENEKKRDDLNKSLEKAEKAYAEFLKDRFKESVVTQLAMVENLEKEMIRDPDSAELMGALYSGALTGTGVGAIGKMGQYAYQFMGGMMVKIVSACDTMCESSIGAILQTLRDTANPGASWWNPLYYVYTTLHYSGLFKVMELVGDDRPFERFLGMFDECSPSRFNGTDAEVAELVGSCRSDTSASSNLGAFLMITLFLIVFLSVIGHYLRLRFQGGRSGHTDSYLPTAAIAVPATTPIVVTNLLRDSNRVKEIKKRLRTLRGLVTDETVLEAAAQNALVIALQSTNQTVWDTALAAARPVTQASQKQEYEEQRGTEYDNIQRKREERLRRLEELDRELAEATALFNAQLKAYQSQRQNIQEVVLRNVSMNAENQLQVMDKMNKLQLKNVESAAGFQDEAATSVRAAIEDARNLVHAQSDTRIKQIAHEGNLMLGDVEESTSTNTSKEEKEEKEGGGKRKKRKTKKRKHAKRKMTRKKRKMTRTKKKQIKRKR